MFKFISGNLKSFFIIIASSIVLVLIILMLIFFRNYNNQRNTVFFIRNLKEISVNFQHLNDAVENYKEAKHPDNFYIYKHDTYSQKVYYYLNLLKNEVAVLTKETSLITFDILSKLNQIKDILSDFESDFELLNENTINLGNSGNGYTENINRTEQKTDKILKTYPQIYNHYQKLKKAKNNLLTIGNRESENRFLKEKNRFLRYLKINQSIFENTSEKQIVINNSADWINSVLQFFKLRKINGTPYYSGIYDNFTNFISNGNNIINDIQDIALTEHINTNHKFLLRFIFLFIILLILLILSAYFLYSFINNQLNHIKNELSGFTVSTENKDLHLSEFESINSLIYLLKKDSETKTEFINSLKSGNLSEITTSFNSNDKLGNALIDLKTFLEKKDTEQKKEERIKAAAEKHKDGIVKFGKIIRQHFGDLDKLSFDLLSELVHFLNADIGGIYIIDKKENSQILKLKASYAYDEKKIINKEIEIGEGAVGTCAADKSSIYIDKIDDDYIKIVSGFGHTKPKSLLLSPIFVENEVYGVIELASSGTFSEHDIKFVETLSEDIAYTLAYLLED